jgi:putative intracellular protease/amidase
LAAENPEGKSTAGETDRKTDICSIDQLHFAEVMEPCPMRFLSFLAAGMMLASSAAAADRLPVLLVLTNHGQLGDTGEATGFYLSEAAHPWQVFEAAGFPVQIASPKGGFAPVDPKSLELDDPANAAFWKKFGNKEGGRSGIAETQSLKTIRPADYSGIFFSGGHGTMWDFADSEAVQNVTAQIYDQGGAVGAVCHGPAALVNVKLRNGQPLVSGKKIATFTNEEEAAVKLTEVVPFLLESKLEEAGATVVPAANFQENAIRDGRLVTGQNPASAKKAATLMIEALNSKH